MTKKLAHAGATLAALTFALLVHTSAASAQQPQRIFPGQGNSPNTQQPQRSPAGQGNSASSSPDAKSALSEADQKIKSAYEKSTSAASLDDYTEIINLCQEGLNGGATGDSAAYARRLQAWAHNRRGEKYSDAGNESLALKDFEIACSLDGKLWKAVQNRGVSRAYLGDTKGARADFDTVLRVNPNYANAWFDRAELKFTQGDFAGALDDYNQAIGRKPNDATFYAKRGHANYRLGKFREALADYNRAVQMDPNNAELLVDRGTAYRQQGVYGPAASDYREAVRLNPKLGIAYLNTAWLMATCPDPRYRDTDKAIAAAKRAIELDGDKDYRYLDTLAAAQASAGKFDDAKATINKVLDKVPIAEATHVHARQELYESGRAFREGAPAETVKPASATVRTP